MKIFNLQTSRADGQVRLSVSVESSRIGLRELWFSVPERFAEGLCTTRMDGFLVGLLFPAMQYGEDLRAEGCVSKQLLDAVNRDVVPLLKAFSPSSRSIRVEAERTGTERFAVRGAGTGFSGGVDSFCTFYDRYVAEPDPEYKISGLFFMNVGSHGRGDDARTEKRFLARYNHLKAFPDEERLDFIPLNSNLHAFHPWGHQQTHTLTAAAGALVMQGLFARYYYASDGVDYNDWAAESVRYRERNIGGYCEPLLIPMLSTESLRLILDGAAYSRIQKTERILHYEPVRHYLNVCVRHTDLLDSHENCSVCPKCCRTLMALESLGGLEAFSNLFDIKKYKRRARLRYVCRQVLESRKDAYARQNVALARARGVRLPPRLICYPVVLFDTACRAAVWAKRKWTERKISG